MRTGRSYSQLGSLALVLAMAAVVLNVGIHTGPSESGAAAAQRPASPILALAPAALWLVALVVAIAAVVRDRGTSRLLPAYFTIGLVTLGIVAAVPTFLHQKDAALDSRAAITRAQSRMRQLEPIAAACAMRGRGQCGAAALAASPGAAALGVHTGRGCTVADVVCVADEVDGGMRIEQITQDIGDMGPLRVTTVVSPTSGMRISCGAVRPDASAARAARVCGPGVDIAPPGSTAPTPTPAPTASV